MLVSGIVFRHLLWSFLVHLVIIVAVVAVDNMRGDEPVHDSGQDLNADNTSEKHSDEKVRGGTGRVSRILKVGFGLREHGVERRK